MELHYLGALVTSNPSHVVWATAQRSSLTCGRLHQANTISAAEWRDGLAVQRVRKKEVSSAAFKQACSLPLLFLLPSPVLGPRRGRGPGC